MSACPDKVVFHKVPSVQNLTHSLNLLEEQEELEGMTYTVEVLESTPCVGVADSLPTDQPETTGDKASILQPWTETAEEGLFSASDRGKVKHATNLKQYSIFKYDF